MHASSNLAPEPLTGRRRNPDRRTQTRELIPCAAVSCLIDRGYSGATTATAV